MWKDRTDCSVKRLSARLLKFPAGPPIEIKFGGSVDPIRVVGHSPGRIRRVRPPRPESAGTSWQVTSRGGGTVRNRLQTPSPAETHVTSKPPVGGVGNVCSQKWGHGWLKGHIQVSRAKMLSGRYRQALNPPPSFPPVDSDSRTTQRGGQFQARACNTLALKAIPRSATHRHRARRWLHSRERARGHVQPRCRGGENVRR